MNEPASWTAEQPHPGQFPRAGARQCAFPRRVLLRPSGNSVPWNPGPRAARRGQRIRQL